MGMKWRAVMSRSEEAKLRNSKDGVMGADGQQKFYGVGVGRSGGGI